MSCCVWQIGDRHYATRAEHVVEVLPMVEARTLAQAPAWIRGLINYRGELIPCVDTGMLLGVAAVPQRMGSRIIVMTLSPGAQQVGHQVGVAVERVVGLHDIDFDGHDSHPGLAVPDAEYLGPVAHGPDGDVQLIEFDRLLDEEHRTVLFSRAEDPA